MRLSEVAALANVSPATVSRVLNNPELVSEELRKRVEALLEKHGYPEKRRKVRRPVRNGKRTVYRIGVWFVGAKMGPTFNWFQEQIRRIEAANLRRAIDLRVLFSRTPEELPPLLAKREIDGVIIQGLEPSEACCRRLEGFPHVWFMTRRSLDYPGDYVEPDNEENGRIAAEYLIDRGHRDLAVIATDRNYSAIDRRIDAFCASAGKLGANVRCIHGPSGEPEGYLDPTPPPEKLEALFAQYAESSPRATGLYLPSDLFCGQFFRAMRTRSLEPDRDFEVTVGNRTEVVYDNLDPIPAAVDINLPTLVSKVIDHLIWRIANPLAPGRVGISVSPRLVLPPTETGVE